MKRRKLLSLFSVLAFVLSVQFSVLGASGPGAEDAPADKKSSEKQNTEKSEKNKKNKKNKKSDSDLVQMVKAE